MNIETYLENGLVYERTTLENNTVIISMKEPEYAVKFELVTPNPKAVDTVVVKASLNKYDTGLVELVDPARVTVNGVTNTLDPDVEGKVTIPIITEVGGTLNIICVLGGHYGNTTVEVKPYEEG